MEALAEVEAVSDENEDIAYIFLVYIESIPFGRKFWAKILFVNYEYTASN